MTSRVLPRRFARACIAVAATSVTLVGLAGPAFADPVAPPGWQDPGNGAWVAFTLGDASLAPVSRADQRWGPVTITRSTSPGLDLASAFTPDSWEARPTPEPGVFEYGWPASWQLGSIQLQRATDWCDRNATTCPYYAVGGAGQPLWFAAGTPLDPQGQPDPNVFPQFDQHANLSLGAPPELNIVFSWDPATATTPASGTTPGRLTLDASGSSDQFPGQLVFSWTVTRASDGKTFTSSPNPVATFDLDADDVYCVSLQVTNTADSFTKSYGVGGTDCQFVNGVTPATAPPGTNPAAGSPGGVGGIPVSQPAAAAPTVVFAPPRRTRSALTGGGDGVDSSIVWLWRPEWYQSSSQTRTLPQTGGTPRLKGRADIVVQGRRTPDSDAGPWLAGLAAFGLIGTGWVLNKRRRVRAEY